MEEYLLYAPSKGCHWNYPVFWGKNDCGYKSVLEDCQIYTKEEAYKRANDDTIPVKLSELKKYTKTVFSGCGEVLNKAAEENPYKHVRG